MTHRCAKETAHVPSVLRSELLTKTVQVEALADLYYDRPRPKLIFRHRIEAENPVRDGWLGEEPRTPLRAAVKRPWPLKCNQHLDTQGMYKESYVSTTYAPRPSYNLEISNFPRYSTCSLAASER
eukprot:6214373-Pleurochrysis_carterae.AAC.4